MPRTFYIIDGHAHIYRSYFAPFRELASPTGEPTKAAFVFTQMLLNLIDHRKPDYLAMVIDAGDETVFRKQLFPEYKANRAKRPDDFGVQERRIIKMVEDAGVPIYFKPGFEADDLLATMAEQLKAQDFDVYMVSKDKDLRQLIGPHVKMYDVQGDEVIDEKAMADKLGYTPAEAVEVQTLIGDPTDNVPGIPGVGEKTAVKLIKKYGSADAVLNHLPELTPKMRENFEQHGKNMPLARQLVTLSRDVDFKWDAEACKYTGLNVDGLRAHLLELGFTNLLKRVGPATGDGAAAGGGAVAAAAKGAKPAAGGPAPAAEPGGLFAGTLFGEGEPGDAGTVAAAAVTNLKTSADLPYEVVTTTAQLKTLVAELRKAKRFAFDTETDALGAMNSSVVGMSFSTAAETGWYVPVSGPEGAEHLSREDVLAALVPLLEDPALKKVGHNIKYDVLAMRNAGITVRGVAGDSMLAAFLLDAGRTQYGIDPLARDLLGFEKVTTVSLIGKGKNQIHMGMVPLDKIGRYAAEDADIALRLADKLTARLAEVPELKTLSDEVETPLIDVLVEMEFNGIAVDPAVLKEQSEVLGKRADELRAKVMAAAGHEFNPDSPKQLADVLFNKLGLKVVKKTKTGASTDVQVLERLADEHPVPKLILEYRSLIKLKNTYLDNLTEHINPKTNRIHGSFNQTGAATGRLSMSDPNLQNIPIRTDEGRRIRLAFVPGDPRKNVLLACDYSQIELRVLAHLSQEPALLRAFEADEDVHRAVASEVFGVKLEDVSRDQRGYAKTINFGIVYGVSAFGLARRIEGLSVKAAQELIDSYNKRFPKIQEFLKACVEHAQQHGYVRTMLGRRRPVPEISAGVMHIRNAAERVAINSVVQGSAADLIKVAMLNVYRRLIAEERPSKMLLQVHDELVFETPEKEVEAEAAMVRAEMTRAGERLGLKVPLKVETAWAKNWGEAK
jgi:DNA polymerase-1